MATLPIFPTLFPTTVKWGIKARTQTFVSSLNGAEQTAELPGARWFADLSYKTLDEAQARPLIAFLARMRGSSGRFLLHDAGHVVPRGTIAGAPTVSGASQTGNTVVLTGFTGTLLEGDYVGLPVLLPDGVTTATEMKVVTADVLGAGVPITVNIEPVIRVSPTAGASVQYSTVQAVMRLLDDNQVKYGRGGSPLYDFNVSCTESFQ